jgi:hypothetical protein
MSVNGFPGNRHEGYTTRAAAEEAWHHAVAVGGTGPAPPPDVAQLSSHINPSLSDEEAYWVVVQGVTPGVYHGM